jgi:hypothetical protein
VPAKSLKTAEIGIIRAQFGVGLHGGSRQVGIPNEVTAGPSCPEQIAQQLGATRARLDDLGISSSNPGTQVFKRLLKAVRRWQGGSRCDSQEPQQHIPGKTHSFRSKPRPTSTRPRFVVKKRKLYQSSKQAR